MRSIVGCGASGDPAFYVVEDVVVKDDHPLSLFSSRNGASCRNVAHFVVDSAGFIRILLFVLTVRFGFRPADVGKVMFFVTFRTRFVPGLALFLPFLYIAAIAVASFPTISALD